MEALSVALPPTRSLLLLWFVGSVSGCLAVYFAVGQSWRRLVLGAAVCGSLGALDGISADAGLAGTLGLAFAWAVMGLVVYGYTLPRRLAGGSLRASSRLRAVTKLMILCLGLAGPLYWHLPTLPLTVRLAMTVLALAAFCTDLLADHAAARSAEGDRSSGSG